MNNTPIYTHNKIGHSSRSSSVQRSKTTADQRCLVITISENLAIQRKKEKKQTDKKKKTAKKNRQTNQGQTDVRNHRGIMGDIL